MKYTFMGPLLRSIITALFNDPLYSRTMVVKMHMKKMSTAFKRATWGEKPRGSSYNKLLLLHCCLTHWAMKGLHRFKYSAYIYFLHKTLQQITQAKMFILFVYRLKQDCSILLHSHKILQYSIKLYICNKHSHYNEHSEEHTNLGLFQFTFSPCGKRKYHLKH